MTTEAIAPETKPMRAMEEIMKDHNALCLRAGMLQYQMTIQGQELQQLNAKINQLNIEAHELQQHVKSSEGKSNGSDPSPSA